MSYHVAPTFSQNHCPMYLMPQAGNISFWRQVRWLTELVHHTATREPGAVRVTIGMSDKSLLYIIWYLEHQTALVTDIIQIYTAVWAKGF